MNNGDGQNNPNFSVNELALVDPSAVVTPEAYANNMQRIQNLKAHLAAYEEKLTTGYTKYRDLEEKQRLEEMVRRGELATYVPSPFILSGENVCDRRLCSAVSCSLSCKEGGGLLQSESSTS